MIKFDAIIVGAGFAGSVFAERLACNGYNVLIIDQRGHTGGNCFDVVNENGILVHNYGPHIFHTNYSTVWKYLSQHTKWIPYQHKVLCLIKGKYVPIPFNLNSLHLLFPHQIAERLESKLIDRYGSGSSIPILELKSNNDAEIASLAEFIFNNILNFRGYNLYEI